MSEIVDKAKALVSTYEQLLEHTRNERDQLRAELARLQRNEDCVQRLIVWANENGWNGVDNSKILDSFIIGLFDALRAELAAAKEERVKQWRCYHCDQVFTDPILAADHFGDDRKNPKPAACEGLLNAYAEAFERYGVHRNHHNAASVKQLANKFQGEVDNLRAENTALAAHVERLEKALESSHSRFASLCSGLGPDVYSLYAKDTELVRSALAAHDAAVKVAVLREVAGKLRNEESANSSLHAEFIEAEAIQIKANADRIEKKAAPDVYDVWKEAANG